MMLKHPFLGFELKFQSTVKPNCSLTYDFNFHVLGLGQPYFQIDMVSIHLSAQILGCILQVLFRKNITATAGP